MTERYPQTIETFLPLLDGMSPLVADDLNEVMDAITAIQDALGSGQSAEYGGTARGPKGRNADVAERLSTFLDADGKLNDVRFVTVTSTVGELAEDHLAGLFIPLGTTMGNTDYRVVIQSFSDATGTGGSGDRTPSETCPGWLWIRTKSTTGFTLGGRTMDNYKIAQNNTETFTLQVLAFGASATP